MQHKQTKKSSTQTENKRYLQTKEVLLRGTTIVWFCIRRDGRDTLNFSLQISISDAPNFP